MATVTWHDERFQQFRHLISSGLAAGLNGNLAPTFRKWGARYRSFTRRRFRNYSRGGGDWPPLAESTLRARRAGKRGTRTKGGRLGKKGASNVSAGAIKISILVDKLGMLDRALEPNFSGQAGALQIGIAYGVRVGYGGHARHPTGKATIADIARFHNNGSGRNPRRQIIVEPDQRTVDGMRRDLEGDIGRLIADLGGD